MAEVKVDFLWWKRSRKLRFGVGPQTLKMVAPTESNLYLSLHTRYRFRGHPSMSRCSMGGCLWSGLSLNHGASAH